MKMFMTSRGTVGYVSETGGATVSNGFAITVIIMLIVMVGLLVYTSMPHTGVYCPACGEEMEIISDARPNDCPYFVCDFKNQAHHRYACYHCHGPSFCAP